MRVLIIADDLTGALDSAVALTGAAQRCVVARRPGDVPAALAERPDVLSVSTASREGRPAAARAAVVAALDAVGVLPEFVFKKVDFRLKGHVASEIAILGARAGRARALVAPAIPTQGRSVVDGQLVGAGVATPINVAAVLEASGLTLEIPDTASETDFDAALGHALDGPPVLLVGAAGLAAALARRLAAGAWAIPVPRLAPPVLLAIGSHDPITIAQVERLAAAGIVTVTAAPDGVCGPMAKGAAQLVRLVAVEGKPFEPFAAGARFADGIAQLVNVGGVQTLFGCGGETTDAILGSLGQGVLTIEGEILPGVPVSTMRLASAGCNLSPSPVGSAVRTPSFRWSRRRRLPWKARDEGRIGTGRTNGRRRRAAREAGACRPGLPPALQPDSNGDYPANQKLPSEKTLADEFGVSRPILRDALERLRDQGLIHSRQGAGSFVREIRSVPLGFARVETIADIQRCYEFRICIETMSARLAATRRRDQGR